MKKKKKGNWVVKARCVVDKEIYCENCTKEEAVLYSLEELKIQMVDWEIDSVKESV